jgi:excisionase family DNA binding protein
MRKKDSPSSSEGRSITGREKTTKATRNAAVEKSVRNKKKRRNPVEELAEKLGFARSTTYDYLDKGMIPGVRIGHRWVLPDDVEQRIKALAYKDWPPPDEKLQRRRKKTSDSENDP